MKKIFSIFLLCLFFSCGNNVEKISPKSNPKDDDMEIEIVSIDSSSLSKRLDNRNKDWSSIFTQYQIEDFNKKNISLDQVYQLEELAKKGDEDAINSLSYVYYLINDQLKLKEILELGLKYNVKEAIYNLVLLEIVNFNYDKSLKYLEKLPKGYKEKEVLSIKQEIYLDQASHALRRKEYTIALNNLKKAYSLGIKDLDYEIYKVYLRLKDNENALHWLKLAADRGDKSVLKELANMYSSLDKSKQAIEIYNSLYESGDIEVSRNLYYEYFKILDAKSAIKWYKISRNLDLVDINPELENLENLYK